MLKFDVDTYGYVADEVRVGIGRCVAVVRAVFAGGCMPAAFASYALAKLGNVQRATRRTCTVTAQRVVVTHLFGLFVSFSFTSLTLSALLPRPGLLLVLLHLQPGPFSFLLGIIVFHLIPAPRPTPHLVIAVGVAIPVHARCRDRDVEGGR